MARVRDNIVVTGNIVVVLNSMHDLQCCRQISEIEANLLQNCVFVQCLEVLIEITEIDLFSIKFQNTQQHIMFLITQPTLFLRCQGFFNRCSLIQHIFKFTQRRPQACSTRRGDVTKLKNPADNLKRLGIFDVNNVSFCWGLQSFSSTKILKLNDISFAQFKDSDHTYISRYRYLRLQVRMPAVDRRRSVNMLYQIDTSYT